MTIPFLEVAHLPSSSSFYSAILQPLGLQYISNPETDSASSPPSSGPCITYGTSFPPTPVFQLRQVGHPTASRIVLTAHSPAAVADFHRFSLRANPDLVPAAGLGTSGGGIGPETEESRARIIDYDGNTMEVVYLPTQQPRHGQPSVRRTQSTTAEANRILNWNYGVTVSTPPTAFGGERRPERSMHGDDDAPYNGFRRTVTSSAVYDSSPAPRETSSGFSTSTVMGTLLGVAAGAAAGAAITYSMVKNDHSRAYKQEFEAPGFSRRATFPEAPFSADRSVPRYVEVERTVEQVRHPNEYPQVDTRRPPPEYITRYSQAGGSQAGGSQKAHSRVAEDVRDDGRSRHSSRQSSASVRTRSANPENRRPLMLTETEHRSYVSSSSSRHSNAPPITRGIQRSHTFDVSDRDSYVSTRSQRSHSTVRPPAAPSVAASQHLAKSRAGSRVSAATAQMPAQAQSSAPRALSRAASYASTATIKMPSHAPSSSPRGPSRAASYVSARNVPLPPSVVGSAHPWNVPLPPSEVGSTWDDDAASVAPSDSISCVGTRRSGRSYYA